MVCKNNTYKIYCKANDKPTYINKNFNHSPSILKQLQKSDQKRLSEILSCKDILEKSLKSCQDALRDSDSSNDLCHAEYNSNANDNKREKKGKWSGSILLFPIV